MIRTSGTFGDFIEQFPGALAGGRQVVFPQVHQLGLEAGVGIEDQFFAGFFEPPLAVLRQAPWRPA